MPIDGYFLCQCHISFGFYLLYFLYLGMIWYLNKLKKTSATVFHDACGKVQHVILDGIF